MDAAFLALAAVAALIGGAIGWLARGARSASDLGAARARAEGAESLVGGLREQLAQERSAQAERADRERSDAAVLQALTPVRESLQAMQRQVAELERERGAQYGTIAAQLRMSLESDEELRRTTESLAGALRSTGTRGLWGEAALRRVVEAAGLTRHVDFTVQTALTGEDGRGRPDMVVRLPGGASVPIDAKVPLDAYLEAVAIPETATGADADRRTQLLRTHVRAVRAHIDALAKRAYWKGLDAAPEFVVCFIPNESLLATALDTDPALLDHAFRQRVALASPVNLWAVLKTVSFAWTQQDVSAEAKQLFELGNTLYDRLGVLAGHADALRRSIERTVESYNAFAGSLETRVLATARKFPGIDDSKLLAEPAPVAVPTRPLASAEQTATPPAATGLDELRRRLADDEADARTPEDGDSGTPAASRSATSRE
ncbi:DNA recombination protein RmuC [Microbacterium sp. LRZ72]|uniref:DNA recombination protein RmuC n=1 Tax=Microbacterium sp. LRZ72 TaxID=2942481 RepID=UPI0029BEC3E9|nr:DNA recombination protein RmuC [Microbacterium sp. LRZ72]MDX2375792.1 DNA recombination protein RmuC [Microbacterium sp. LRZ72]